MTEHSTPNPFKIKRTGFLWRKRRLVAPAQLSPDNFKAIAAALDATPRRARKRSLIAASRAQERQEIETNWESEVTKNVAEVGDWIVTNLLPNGEVLQDEAGRHNTYVIRSDRFWELYQRARGETEFGPVFEARNEVKALYLSGGFDIAAPWGEQQTADDGYILLNQAEIYGNERTAFEATYEMLR